MLGCCVSFSITMQPVLAMLLLHNDYGVYIGAKTQRT